MKNVIALCIFLQFSPSFVIDLFLCSWLAQFLASFLLNLSPWNSWQVPSMWNLKKHDVSDRTSQGERKVVLKFLSIHFLCSPFWVLCVSGAPLTPGREASDITLALKASQISHSNSWSKHSPSLGPADAKPPIPFTVTETGSFHS